MCRWHGDEHHFVHNLNNGGLLVVAKHEQRAI